MNRNSIAVAVIVAVIAAGGLFLSMSEDQPSTLAMSPVANEVFAGAINGNVPTIAYDNVRVYTQIVLPPGSANDPFCQQVNQTFGGNPTLRNRSIVRLNYADQNFAYKWGRSFESAARGYPMVAVFYECGDKVQSVDYVTLSPKSDLSSALSKIVKAVVEININRPPCPCTPKPPGPGPAPNNPNPTLPPLDNHPSDPQDLVSDNKAGLILVACVALIAGLVAYYKRD